ncbi:MAG: hypothetical protein R6X23_15830, partial [Acidimicrobiia bacterium]
MLLLRRLLLRRLFLRWLLLRRLFLRRCCARFRRDPGGAPPRPEALANAMLYGNGRDPSKRVKVEVAFQESTITARITDEGRG